MLAAIGVGGMLAMSVSRRLPELGVRMALGAQRRTLVAMVIRQAMVLAAAGLAVGLPGAWLMSRVLSSLFFEIGPRDPITFATVAAVFLLLQPEDPYPEAGSADTVLPERPDWGR